MNGWGRDKPGDIEGKDFAILIRHLVLNDERQLRDLLIVQDDGKSLRPTQFAPPEYEWSVGAFCDGQLSGFIGVSDLDGHKQILIAVHVAWRRRGIASALVRAAIARASAEGEQSLRIICSRSDWPMRRFLNKTGAKLDLVFGEIVAQFQSGIKTED